LDVGRGGQRADRHRRAIIEAMDAIVLDRSFRVWRYGVGHSQLLLQPEAGTTRDEILAFAGIPARHQHRFLTLTLPSPPTEPGFVVCGRASVLAIATTGDQDPSGFGPAQSPPDPRPTPSRFRVLICRELCASISREPSLFVVDDRFVRHPELPRTGIWSSVPPSSEGQRVHSRGPAVSHGDGRHTLAA
jgi:hypothetical protein